MGVDSRDNFLCKLLLFMVIELIVSAVNMV